MAINAIDSSTKKHTAAKIAGTVLTAAAATGVAMYLAKTGKLNAVEGGNKYIEQAKAAIKKPADFLNGKLTEGIEKLSQSESLARKMNKAQGYIKAGINKINANPKVGAAKNFVKVEKDALAAKVVKLENTIENKLSGVLDFVESKFHPEKFL